MKSKTTNTIAALALILAAPLNAQTKTLSWGNWAVGATATGTMSHYIPPSKDSCNFYNSARVDGRLVTKTFNLASGVANFRIAAGSQASNASGYLRAGSKTLAYWNKNFNGADGYSTDPILQVVKGPGVNFFGIVDAGIDGYVSANAYALAIASPSSGSLKIQGGLKASAGAKVYGSALWGAIGARGTLTLCEAGLQASADMKPHSDPLKFYTSAVDYKFDLITRSPHGKVEVWAPGLGTRTVANFTGTTKTYNLASGSFELVKTPILK
jgi:hypothetical protein